ASGVAHWDISYRQCELRVAAQPQAGTISIWFCPLIVLQCHLL
ncbi:hypothetical protein Nmel_015160, partial [Mimus melanotis]